MSEEPNYVDGGGVVLFDIGRLLAYEEAMDDGRVGLTLEASRLVSAGITPEAIIYVRNKLTEFLQNNNYE